jgi:Arc/MetJ family transcription regulator
MRTNIVINDELLREAGTYTNARTKKDIVEEALKTFVRIKEKERRTASYIDRLAELDRKIEGIRLRKPPSEILREDRDRR